MERREHRAKRQWYLQKFHIGKLRQHVKRRVNLVERCYIACEAVDHHVGDEHKEHIEHNQTSDLRARVLGFGTERCRTFEADQAENYQYHAEAHA
jgi:hypothetical protein